MNISFNQFNNIINNGEEKNNIKNFISSKCNYLTNGIKKRKS